MVLIDKESLIEHMRKAYKGNTKAGFKWDLECTVVVIECEEEINRPIVRCKDCKYMSTKGKTTRFYFCNEFEISVDETDYCAWGEKKDE